MSTATTSLWDIDNPSHEAEAEVLSTIRNRAAHLRRTRDEQCAGIGAKYGDKEWEKWQRDRATREELIAHDAAWLQFREHMGAIAEELAAIEHQLDVLPRRYAAHRAEVEQHRLYGGEIRVPDFPAALLDLSDTKVTKLETELAAINREEHNLIADRPILEVGASAQEVYVQQMAARFGVKLVSLEEMKTAEQALRGLHQQIEKLDTRLVEISHRREQIRVALEERRVVVRRERDARGLKELQTEYATFVREGRKLAAIATRCQRLRRVIDDADADTYPSLTYFDADALQSPIRKLFESIADAGISE